MNRKETSEMLGTAGDDRTAIFKYNGGAGALLCTGCRKILKIGSEFNKEEHLAMRGETSLPPQFCDTCKP